MRARPRGGARIDVVRDRAVGITRTGAGLPPTARMLLLGSGPTASDAFATLAAQGHQGPVTALSRRGRRPARQNPFPSRITSVWGMLRDPNPAFVARHGAPATVRGTLRALLSPGVVLDMHFLSRWVRPDDLLYIAVFAALWVLAHVLESAASLSDEVEQFV